MNNVELREASDSDLVVLRVFHGEHVVSVTLYPDDIHDLMDATVEWVHDHPDDRDELEEPSFEEITQQAINDDHLRDPGLAVQHNYKPEER